MQFDSFLYNKIQFWCFYQMGTGAITIIQTMDGFAPLCKCLLLGCSEKNWSTGLWFFLIILNLLDECYSVTKLQITKLNLKFQTFSASTTTGSTYLITNRLLSIWDHVKKAWLMMHLSKEV